jgi:redox-sensitive bicupin YhaK (pirin superfamily)
MSIRPVKRFSQSKPMREGAGVHLRRAFGFGKTADFDPFLLLGFLLVAGEPLKEPVAWYGPIVMNTQEQLQKAFEQLREGTFLNAK